MTHHKTQICEKNLASLVGDLLIFRQGQTFWNTHPCSRSWYK